MVQLRTRRGGVFAIIEPVRGVPRVLDDAHDVIQGSMLGGIAWTRKLWYH